MLLYTLVASAHSVSSSASQFAALICCEQGNHKHAYLNWVENSCRQGPRDLFCMDLVRSVCPVEPSFCLMLVLSYVLYRCTCWKVRFCPLIPPFLSGFLLPPPFICPTLELYKKNVLRAQKFLCTSSPGWIAAMYADEEENDVIIFISNEMLICQDSCDTGFLNWTFILFSLLCLWRFWNCFSFSSFGGFYFYTEAEDA